MERPPKAPLTAKHIQEQELLFNNLRTNTNATQSHTGNNYYQSEVANDNKNQSFSSSITLARLPSGLPLFAQKFPAEKEHLDVKSQANYKLNIAISDDNASNFTDQPVSEFVYGQQSSPNLLKTFGRTVTVDNGNKCYPHTLKHAKSVKMRSLRDHPALSPINTRRTEEEKNAAKKRT